MCPGRRTVAAAPAMAGRTAALLPVLQRLDLLPLDRVLEMGVPFPLFRRACGRIRRDEPRAASCRQTAVCRCKNLGINGKLK